MLKSESKSRPSDLELQILAVLWDHGPSTVRQIMDSLSDDKQRGYTAVLSVVQSMQRKKLVSAKRVRNERAYLYAAKRSRESILGPMLGGLVERVFGGDPAAAVQQLLASSDLEPDTISRLRNIIADAETRASASGGDGQMTELGEPK